MRPVAGRSRSRRHGRGLPLLCGDENYRPNPAGQNTELFFTIAVHVGYPCAGAPDELGVQFWEREMMFTGGCVGLGAPHWFAVNVASPRADQDTLPSGTAMVVAPLIVGVHIKYMRARKFRTRSVFAVCEKPKEGLSAVRSTKPA